MDRIVFLGMDLSGKSRAAQNTASTLGKIVRSNLLTADKTIYIEAVNKMKTGNLTDQEKLYLFSTIYQHDLDVFKDSEEEQTISLVQDNFGIVRNISYFDYNGYDVNALITILKSYSKPTHSFYLTCSKKERLKRLEGRSKDKPEDVYERLLREHPKAFFEMDKIAKELYSHYFDCDLIDNTNINEEETTEYVLSRLGK